MHAIDALRTLTALSVVGCGGLADRVSQPKSDDSGTFSQPYLTVSVYDPPLPLVTARDAALPVRLVSGAAAYSSMSFAGLLQDRSLGESVIRSLVTETEETETDRKGGMSHILRANPSSSGSVPSGPPCSVFLTDRRWT